MASLTREETITNMCYTTRHDYGLDRSADSALSSGMTELERVALWNQMAQIYDNIFSPILDSLTNGSS